MSSAYKFNIFNSLDFLVIIELRFNNLFNFFKCEIDVFGVLLDDHSMVILVKSQPSNWKIHLISVYKLVHNHSNLLILRWASINEFDRFNDWIGHKIKNFIFQSKIPKSAIYFLRHYVLICTRMPLVSDRYSLGPFWAPWHLPIGLFLSLLDLIFDVVK